MTHEETASSSPQPPSSGGSPSKPAFLTHAHHVSDAIVHLRRLSNIAYSVVPEAKSDDKFFLTSPERHAVSRSQAYARGLYTLSDTFGLVVPCLTPGQYKSKERFLNPSEGFVETYTTLEVALVLLFSSVRYLSPAKIKQRESANTFFNSAAWSLIPLQATPSHQEDEAHFQIPGVRFLFNYHGHALEHLIANEEALTRKRT